MYLTASVQITEQLLESDTGKAFLLIAHIPTTQGTVPISLKQLFNWKTFYRHHWCLSSRKWVNKRMVSFWHLLWGLLVPYSVSLKSLQKSVVHQVSIALRYFPAFTRYLKHSVLCCFCLLLTCHDSLWTLAFKGRKRSDRALAVIHLHVLTFTPFTPFMNNHWSQYPVLATCFLH